MDIDNEDFISSMDGILQQFSNLEQTTDYICFKIIIKDHYLINKKDFKTINHSIAKLNDIRKTIFEICSQFNSKYAWYKDIFNISVIIDESISNDKDRKMCYLQGCIRYGANTDDAQYVLFLCNFISNYFKNLVQPIDLIINITDHDGDVLLIEAADVIPDYLNDFPDYSMNRVWLINGFVYIIPFKIESKFDYKQKTKWKMEYLTLMDAADIAMSVFKSSIGSESKSQAGLAGIVKNNEILKVLHCRIERYPGYSLAGLHECVVAVPAEMGVLLSQFPALVTKLTAHLINCLSIGSGQDYSLFASGRDGDTKGHCCGNCSHGIDSFNHRHNYFISKMLRNVDMLCANADTEIPAQGFVLVQVRCTKGMYAELHYAQSQYEASESQGQAKEVGCDYYGSLLGRLGAAGLATDDVSLGLGMLPTRYRELVNKLINHYELHSIYASNETDRIPICIGILKGILLGCHLLHSVDLYMECCFGSEPVLDSASDADITYSNNSTLRVPSIDSVRERGIPYSAIHWSYPSAAPAKPLHTRHPVDKEHTAEEEEDIGQKGEDRVYDHERQKMDLMGTPDTNYKYLSVLLEYHSVDEMSNDLHQYIHMIPEVDNKECSVVDNGVLCPYSDNISMLDVLELLLLHKHCQIDFASMKIRAGISEASWRMQLLHDIATSDHILKVERGNGKCQLLHMLDPTLEPITASDINNERWLYLEPEAFDSEMRNLTSKYNQVRSSDCGSNFASSNNGESGKKNPTEAFSVSHTVHDENKNGSEKFEAEVASNGTTVPTDSKIKIDSNKNKWDGEQMALLECLCPIELNISNLASSHGGGIIHHVDDNLDMYKILDILQGNIMVTSDLDRRANTNKTDDSSKFRDQGQEYDGESSIDRDIFNYFEHESDPESDSESEGMESESKDIDSADVENVNRKSDAIASRAHVGMGTFTIAEDSMYSDDPRVPRESQAEEVDSDDNSEYCNCSENASEDADDDKDRDFMEGYMVCGAYVVLQVLFL